MTDHPPARLADLLRGREDHLGPLTCRIIDAALDDEHPPVDLQTVALAAAANLIVQLKPPAKLRQRARDAETMLKRLIHAHGKRMAEMKIDVARDQRGLNTDLIDAFGDCWRVVLANQPIDPKWIEAGITSPDHLRETLLSSALQEGMAELFSRIFTEQLTDRVAATLATVAAAAMLCASPYDTDKPGTDEGYADLIVDEFRATLLRTFAYWREKKGH